MPGAGGDEGLVGDVLDAHPGAPGQRVVGAQRQADLLVEQQDALQALGGDRLGGDGEVDVPGPQPAGHLLGGQLVQFDLHAGVGLLERRQRPAEGQEGLRGQPYRAEALPGGLGHRAPPGLQLAERALHVAAEDPPGPVEAQPPAPVEQRGAQLGLQAGDAAAQRRLGDAQFGSRAAQVLQPRHGEELRERVQVHRCPQVRDGITPWRY